MIVSRNLLAEFFPAIKDFSLEEISKVFFRSGIEVEKCEKIVAPSGIYYGVIEKVEKVGNSDKLNLCQVFIPFKKERFSIVCGASNVREGIKVLVALPGAKLLNGDFVISERKFESWGIVSYGMICGYTELYKSNLLKAIFENPFEKGQIIEFSEFWDTSKPFEPSDLWLDDWIFDLSIPANRGDLHSVWGLSRELCKLLGKGKNDLKNGTFYQDLKDIWFLKRALLVNNQREVSIDRYLYLIFNETNGESKLLIRKKSEYFKKLRDCFLKKELLEDFEFKKISICRKRIFDFLGLDKECEFRGDFFVLEDDYALVPEWRVDIQTERDVVDEIVCFIGWDNLISKPISSSIGLSHLNKNQQILAVEKIRELWRSLGFYECTTFNLHRKNIDEISVNNPLSEEHVSLRKHALFELLEVIKRNYRGKNELKPVFEISEEQFLNRESKWILNVLIPEKRDLFLLGETKLAFDLFDIKALIEKTSRYLNSNFCFLKSENFDDLFSKTNYLEIQENQMKIGSLGYLKTDLPFNVWGFYMEIFFNPCKKNKTFRISKYPPSYKDISLEIDKSKNLSIGKIIGELRSKYLVSTRIVEKYETEDILSYLIRIKFQSYENTLSGEEIQQSISEINQILEKVDGVKLR